MPCLSYTHCKTARKAGDNSGSFARNFEKSYVCRICGLDCRGAQKAREARIYTVPGVKFGLCSLFIGLGALCGWLFRWPLV